MKQNFNRTHTEKNIILLFIMLIGLLLLSTYANGQSLINKTTFSPEETDSYVVKYFQASEIEGVIYFKFLIHENRNNIRYVLESSANDKDFIPVTTKTGFLSPTNTPLLYCYKINTLDNPDRIFRVKIESDENIDYSRTLYINAPTSELTASKLN